MARVIKNNSPLSTQPLKTSPATGATVATLGFQGSIPLLHGAQGCAAFNKIYLISHFREAIPIQNTAIDQVAAVMGGDENLLAAMQLLCEKHAPTLISVMTTGLTELQGTDLSRVIMDFKRANPQFDSTRIVAMNTPDFTGSMQSGFAHAVDRIVRQLVLPPSKIKRQRKLVNVLCSVGMTAVDIETLKGYLDAFNLDAVIVPDISLSLDGHTGDSDYSPVSLGGTSVYEVEMMSEAAMTIIIGESMLPTAKWLEKRFAIPYIRTDMGMGIDSVDKLIMALTELSGMPVPGWITRARKRLQDAMVDTHFYLTHATVSLGLEPDLATGYARLLGSMGCRISRVVTTLDTPGLQQIDADEILIGDLSMLLPSNQPVSAVISNTHAAHICEPEIPVIRAGYPCHDQFGIMDVRQFGYEGSRERIFALANSIMLNHKEEVEPHISGYRFSPSEVTRKETL
ncbi:nitrogenase iron-molybdenum cofactor biosynthesis protein NifN [Vibrio sp. HA2012]|uniref:nitrogenase iron-molybdenum cofactor biosynthesis protein NifN n=1 Tax=Vibrio sp. HA2012 TaxID=1971595 RepID=UPI000C2BA32B|nr:nitrogenase iron-molybdenum cofactor biosynthesis protein NifN [Vibrio sp. HA2012]PJC87610.1 nitrogenase iron-molybdenum cofactor biosynthesis protein NifN [Vibrio sp. HA2012]